MLLPSLQKAREKARQGVCISNMKQIYSALIMYAQDYNGWLVHCYKDGVGISSYWPNMLGKYKYFGKYNYHSISKWVYGTPKFLYCLSDPEGTTVKAYGGGYYHGSSYSLNIWVFGRTDGTYPYHRIESYAKSKRLWIATYPTPGYGGKHIFLTGPPSKWHNGGSNICWGDGHIKWTNADTFNDAEP